MKLAANIVGAVLGLLFTAGAIMFLLGKVPEQPAMPPDVLAFMGLFGKTGYMKFVKVTELIGGILIAIPRTRNVGLLVIGPIIVNILAFHVFIGSGATFNAPTILVAAMAAFLLWAGRKSFSGLLG